HTAIIELLGLSERLKYKAARARAFWPEASPGERRQRILEALRRILAGLRRDVRGDPFALPRATDVRALVTLKRFEDATDALVCAWVGIRYLERRATPLGDAHAAVWIPTRAPLVAR